MSGKVAHEFTRCGLRTEELREVYTMTSGETVVIVCYRTQGGGFAWSDSYQQRGVAPNLGAALRLTVTEWCKKDAKEAITAEEWSEER